MSCCCSGRCGGCGGCNCCCRCNRCGCCGRPYHYGNGYYPYWNQPYWGAAGSWGSGGGGPIPVTYTINSTSEWVMPAGCSSQTVTVVGAGGIGGAAGEVGPGAVGGGYSTAQCEARGETGPGSNCGSWGSNT